MRAGAALSAGHSVVFDAVFAHENERDQAAALAAKLGVAFHGIWLDAPEAILRSRVAGRKSDASDATTEVVARQLTYDLGRLTWERLDASGSPSETLARVRQILAFRPAVPA